VSARPPFGGDRAWESDYDRARRAVTATCFGDGTGLTLFLAALAWLVLTWRVGTFFNDVAMEIIFGEEEAQVF
jgi:hypothetical protein